MTQTVEAIWLKETGPDMIQGRLNTSTPLLELSLETKDVPPIGSRLILYGNEIQMLSTRVVEVNNNRILLEREDRKTDKRLHPRLYGNIPTLIQSSETHDNEAWLSNQLEIESGWFSPEPFMNFSVNGLSFEIDVPFEIGNHCLLEFSVGDQPRKHRALATVIRCIPTGEIFELALHFKKISNDAMADLSDFTISIQEALLQQ